MKKVVVYGFLGSGKTTVINHLLRNFWVDQKVVVIENESGSESVDGDFLRDNSFNVVDMRSGCICCTLRNELPAAVATIEEQIAPDVVVIEPSGIASLEDILSIPRLEVDSIITLIDLTRYPLLMRLNRDFYLQQFRLSPIIILTKSDLVDPNTIEEIRDELEKLNPTAVIITDYHPIANELWSQYLNDHCKKFRALVFRKDFKPLDIVNHTFELTSPITTHGVEKVIESLEKLNLTPIRMKGIVAIGDSIHKLDYVGLGIETTLLSNTPSSESYLTLWWCNNDINTECDIKLTTKQIISSYIYG